MNTTTKQELPNPWTDLADRITPEQMKNLLQFPEVTVYFTGEPVAVLLTVERYQKMAAELARFRAVGLSHE